MHMHRKGTEEVQTFVLPQKGNVPLGFRSVKISRVYCMSQNKSVVFVRAVETPAAAKKLK